MHQIWAIVKTAILKNTSVRRYWDCLLMLILNSCNSLNSFFPLRLCVLGRRSLRGRWGEVCFA